MPEKRSRTFTLALWSRLGLQGGAGLFPYTQQFVICPAVVRGWIAFVVISDSIGHVFQRSPQPLDLVGGLPRHPSYFHCTHCCTLEIIIAIACDGIAKMDAHFAQPLNDIRLLHDCA